MTSNHPIVLPHWLLDALCSQAQAMGADLECLFTEAARWGADQELKACCADLRTVLGPNQADWLHSVRRPGPSSLKKQALGALYAIATGADDTREFYQDVETIKEALEQLND